jgi:glycosyltransferase involved in cell wall biosynthesis
MTAVTVVISTHNRPDELCAAIAGVCLQTRQDWQALVIGDACSDETGMRLAALSDPRIRYINLTQRVGEQSGPNSVGMALADTEFIAFLNQDDLWLPDHLAHAIDCLRSAKADFFTGRAAFAIADPDDAKRTILSEASPVGRRLYEAFLSRYQLFEPISAWVMTARAVRRVGLFARAANLFRTPLENWILRAWRKGLMHIDTPLITVLKNDVKWGSAGDCEVLYDQTSRPLTEWLGRVEQAGIDEARIQIESDLAQAGRRGLAKNITKFLGPGDFPWIANRLLTPSALEVFERTGWDAMQSVCQASGLKRGWFLRRLLLRRTGEELPDPPDFDALLSDARAQLRALRSEPH